MAATPGYSGTPLAKKLAIKPGASILTIGAPDAYLEWLDPLPDGVRIGETPADVIHLFAASRAELERHLAAARRSMKIDGALWVSWYKKAAGIPTDLTENEVRAAGLATDLVDVKVCAVSETWSGLKFVVRKALR